MPHRCVAAGCSKTSKDGVHLFHFPKDSELRKKWAAAVHRTRAGWAGPTSYSELCSDHFAPECFEPDKVLYESLGVGGKRPRLVPGAVPPVFSRVKETAVPPPSKKPLSAYQKRQQKRV